MYVQSGCKASSLLSTLCFRYIDENGYASIVYVQSGCEAPSKRDIWVQVENLALFMITGSFFIPNLKGNNVDFDF